MANSVPIATYSIAACDLDASQWGVAVQSKFLAVGSVVPWAEPLVGAIATQSWANPRYGPDGLALLRDGLPLRGRRRAETPHGSQQRPHGRRDGGERGMAHQAAPTSEEASRTASEMPARRRRRAAAYSAQNPAGA